MKPESRSILLSTLLITLSFLYCLFFLNALVADNAVGMAFTGLISLVLFIGAALPIARKLMQPGAMDISLSQPSFKIGESATGKISLKLRKETHARALIVKFYGEKRIPGKKCHVEIICPARQQISGRRIYLSSETHKFSVPVPKEAAACPHPIKLCLYPESMAQMFPPGQILYFPSIKWYVEAKLDIQARFDVVERVEVKLSAPSNMDALVASIPRKQLDRLRRPF